MVVAVVIVKAEKIICNKITNNKKEEEEGGNLERNGIFVSPSSFILHLLCYNIAP
jgi:hypothetical protein